MSIIFSVLLGIVLVTSGSRVCIGYEGSDVYIRCFSRGTEKKWFGDSMKEGCGKNYNS